MKKRTGKGGRLSEDDLALWRQVTARTEKLDLNNLFNQAVESAPLDLQAARPSSPSATDRFRVERPNAAKKQTSFDLVPSVTDRLKSAPIQMDGKAFKRMSRGKLKPEARIDLHGMTLDRAHPALMRFVMSSQQQGRRLVLVITGKGRNRDDSGPIPVRHGVLRHQVPQWLSMPPLASVVLQVSPAHISHGGAGAYYVYLRRNR